MVTYTDPAQRQRSNRRSLHPSSHNKLCKFYVRGYCDNGNRCRFLHAFSNTPHATFLTQLLGHQNPVKAIVLPSKANKLYTAGHDKTIRMWDCETAECIDVLRMDGHVNCLLSDSNWLFVGLPDQIKAFHLHNKAQQQTLQGLKGHEVLVLAIGYGLLLAGAQDGNVFSWSLENSFQPVALLQGHTAAVVALETMETRLFSGSADKSIRVWDLHKRECLQVVWQAHKNVVTALVCWNDHFLLSGSLDGTIKVWNVAQDESHALLYTHSTSSQALAFCGFVDHDNKSLLLCSLRDNTIRILELPSFEERGVLSFKDDVAALEVGPGGLIFCGDNNGGVKVWKWAPPSVT